MNNLVNVDLVKALQLRDLDTAETEMLKYDQAECGVIHRFYPGIYIREVTLPKGILAIGHYQKKEHLNVFLTGRVTMLKDSGGVEDIQAPMIFMGEPGRKVGFIHEQVTWLNIYPTNETDVEKLETEFLDKSDAFKLNESEKIKRYIDIEDYKNVLKEYGFTEEEVRKVAENEQDQIPMPFGGQKSKISNSAIEGKGVFATANIGDNELIGPARIGGMRTPLGRFTNHSVNPNARMVQIDNDIVLASTRPIKGCMGGQDGEEITINYREALQLGGLKCQA